MSELKHTQGPWEVSELDKTKVWGNRKCVSWSTNEAQNRYHYPDKTEEEMKANAKLIAAAPDLLAACQMAKEELIFGGDWENAKVIIEKAIKKATE